jgi:hypothetical protein
MMTSITIHQGIAYKPGEGKPFPPVQEVSCNPALFDENSKIDAKECAG